jgi:hypothetical protein
MDACLLMSMPWPYLMLALVVATFNWLYLRTKLRDSNNGMRWMQVQRRFLQGAYDNDAWARFARKFTFVSMVAFPIFGLVWFFLVQAVFPACR